MGDIVVSFPEARARLRWAQIQIAMMRGIQRIASVMKELEAQGKVDLTELSEAMRFTLIQQILGGEFDDVHKFEDHFGVDAVERPPETGRLSPTRIDRRSQAETDSVLHQLAKTNVQAAGRTSSGELVQRQEANAEDSTQTDSYQVHLMEELVHAVRSIQGSL